MSSGRWSQVATAGVRSALLALMSRYGLETCNPSPVITRPPGKPTSNLTQNLSLPSTSSQSAFSS